MRFTAWVQFLPVTHAVLHALHDSRMALGDAEPCCETCDADVLGYGVCPASMQEPPERVVKWSDFFDGIKVKNMTVTIPCGMRVDLDVSPPRLAGLYVRGHLRVVDGQDVKLRSDRVYVCGVFSAGSADAPHNSKLEIQMTGRRSVNEDGIDYGVKTFAVFGGLVYLRGTETVSWAHLQDSVYPGDTRISLPVAWPAGSQIVVASTDWDAEQSEEMVLASATSVTEPFRFAHSGVAPTAAEVARLTRNIVITSDCSMTAHRPICGHFVISHTPHGVVRGVEFTHLGQQTTLGKYPLHLHMCGRAHDLDVRFNSIHHNVNRALVVHSTADSTITRNVAFLTQGHMFVFENGLEIRNWVVENLGMLSRSPHPKWTCKGYRCAGADNCGFGTGDSIEACGSRDDNQAEIFWLANPQNDLVGNVAVGGSKSGFSFYPVFSGPMVDNEDEQRKIGLPEHTISYLKSKRQWCASNKRRNPKSTKPCRPGGSYLDKKLYGPERAWKPADSSGTFQYYQRGGGRHVEFLTMGVFERNVVHSSRIGFIIYPQITPRIDAPRNVDATGLANAVWQRARWLNLTAYKIFGTAFRFKTRCANWECLSVEGALVLASSMAIRARDTHTRVKLVDSFVVPPSSRYPLLADARRLDEASVDYDDPAFTGGACLSGNVDRSPFRTCRGFSKGEYARPTRLYDGQNASAAALVWCSPCNASWPPRETNVGFTKGRGCDTPYWAINYDRESMDTSDICKPAKNGEVHSSCATHRSGFNLSATIKVDQATLDRMRDFGYDGDYIAGRQSESFSPSGRHDCDGHSRLVLGSFHLADQHKFPEFEF